MRALVAVVRVTPDTVLSDIDRLVDLGGAAQALTPGCTTILKDNISWHFPFPAANTTPWQLEGTIQALSRRGYADQVCVQNKTVVTNAFKGEDLNHYVPIFRKYGVPVLYNFKDEDMKWVRYQPTTRMRVLDRIYPEGIRIPDFFFGKNIVHLPTTKCHIYTTTTGAMKNAFGGLLNTRRHYTHSWIHETLVDLLAIQKEIHSGLFAIMDGTTAGNGPGPRTMYPVVKNVMLASQDQVAIDAVAAKMMGFDPMSIPYIRLAHEQGLGIGDPRRIEIAGEVDAAHENWRFHVGKNLVRVAGGDLIWFGPLRRFQKLFFRTPLVNGFILASDVYHDFYRWPLVDRRRFERWCETTGWGQLFLRYARLGPQGEPFVARSQAAITVPTSTSVH
ncbi:MAG: iron-sulfur cluster-binding protein [Acidobacteria bacterium]|nr:MAG: iron-sulfur cluster-binding protein [Acidobacteriota bacterium]